MYLSAFIPPSLSLSFLPFQKKNDFLRNFVEEKMGSKFVEGRSVEFSKSYEESSQSTPIFFILSPGVDPLKDVEALGRLV